MNYRANTIERAYQLAESGECATIEQIKQQLRGEGYDTSQLTSAPSLVRTLRKICAATHGQTSSNQKEDRKTL